ncbi:MAG: transporter [Verrucomicrobia bacterium]|nr:transporter [Verrucomicrobiota bacterium]
MICLLASLPVMLQAQVTESPYTVAPGRFLVEMDGLRLSYDHDPAGNKLTGLAVASTFLTTGLTATVDLQVGMDVFLRHAAEIRGLRDTRAGIGDLYFRSKWTFWQDKAAGAAMAVMPYIKIPSNSAGLGNDSVEGGLIVPWELKTGAGFTAGAMLNWDVMRNDDDNGYDMHWHLTGMAQREITKSLAAYAEAMLSFYSSGWSNWQGRVGAGLLWQVTRSLQLDYELVRGLNRRATDWEHVVRVNWEW